MIPVRHSGPRHAARPVGRHRRVSPVLPRVALAVAAAVMGSCVVSGVSFSDATWSDSSQTGFAVSAALDWTAPSVSMVDPGAVVSGTSTVAAVASDDRSSVASVLFEYDAPGTPDVWIPVCTDTTAPYSCAWDTSAVADNSGYRLRATATDTGGLQKVSSTVFTRVKNYYLSLAAVPAAVRGTVNLSATWHGAGPQSVTFQRSADGTTGWQPIGCTLITANPTATCAWDTTGSDSQLWHVRATLGYVGTTYDTQTAGVIVDNVLPTVALTVPPGTLVGTVQLTATANDVDTDIGDASSGVADVRFEYRRQGAATWTTCGDDTSAPYACPLGTTSLSDGTYEFRATVTDGAGNAVTTATQTRTVNNTTPWVRVTSPSDGATIAQGADIVLTADALAAAGIASVRFEFDPPGPTSWTTICTDTTAPYSCPVDTITAPAGVSSVRAVMTTTGGSQVTSPAVNLTIVQMAAVEVDARPAEGPAAAQVIPGAGDVLTFTYSGVVAPSSIKAGWDGLAATPVGLSLRDKNVSGAQINGRDWLAFTDTNLGQVSFSQGYVASGGNVAFTGSTMTLATVTVGGVARSVVTVTLGTPDPLTASKLTAVGTGTMTWTPSTSVLSVDGSVCSGAAAIEIGTLDTDL